MRRVEREYYDKELLIHKNNLRTFWEIIKDVINKKLSWSQINWKSI